MSTDLKFNIYAMAEPKTLAEAAVVIKELTEMFIEINEGLAKLLLVLKERNLQDEQDEHDEDS